MKFYNNIFASSYGLYIKYYSSSRATFRATTIVAIHMIGLIFLLFALIKKLFSLNYNGLHDTSTIIALVALALCLYQLMKYYSAKRVNNVLSTFQYYKVATRKLWDFITVATLITEYIAFALLLSK